MINIKDSIDKEIKINPTYLAPRRYDSIKLNEMHYKKEVEEFISLVTKNVDIKYLANMYNNYNSLYVTNCNFLNRTDAIAYYILVDNFIYCPDNLKEVLFHELFHAASSVITNNGLIIHSGFAQYTGDIKLYEVGFGLNELYSDILAERYVGYPTKYASRVEHNMLKLFEKIFGHKKMLNMYLTANLDGFVSVLSKYCEITDIYKMLNSLDLIVEMAKITNPVTDEEYFECLNEVTYIMYDVITQLLLNYRYKNNNAVIKELLNDPNQLHVMYAPDSWKDGTLAGHEKYLKKIKAK